MTVICLETDIEKDYSQFLSEFIEETVEDKSPESIALIRSFWNDEYTWENIQRMAAV